MLTTPPHLADLESLFPELAGFRGTATRLHPRRGVPGVRDSHIGGPLLWPVDESWPVCTASHEEWVGQAGDWPGRVWTVGQVGVKRELLDLGHSRGGVLDRLTPEEKARYDAADKGVPLEELLKGPVPLLPIAQLRREDVPDFIGPDDADLMQVLWCPVDHEEDYVPAVTIRWRREGDVGEVLADPPKPLVGDDYYVPRACAVAPERVREYEYTALLPEGLRERIKDWQGTSGRWFESVAPGWKAGGFARWNLSDPYEIACEECGGELRLVLCVEGGLHPTWDPGTHDEPDPTEVNIGRGYGLWVWCCAKDFGHPVQTTMQ